MTGNLYNLQGVHLSVVALEDKEYPHRIEIDINQNGTAEFVGGFCYDLLLAMQHALKFSYTAISGTEWIGRFPNGTLTGMSAQVINGEADICISQASMVMLTQRLDLMSYLLPTSKGQLTAIFKQPRSTRDILANAFNFRIWICWSFVWITILFSLTFFRFVIQKFKLKKSSSLPKKRNNKAAGYIKTIMDLIFWGLSTFSCQGWFDKPKETSIKCIFIVAIVFAYVISIFFSASLTSDLASETVQIKTFIDLIKSNLKVYGDRRLPVVRDLVKEIKILRGHLSKESMEGNSPEFINVTKSTKVIEAESAAFITFEDAAESAFLQSQYFCEKISFVNVNNVPMPNAMFVKRGSNLKEIFNRKITNMIERGITFRLNVVYSKKTSLKCPIISKNYRGGLAFSDIGISYIVLVIGILLSCTCILAEKYYDYYGK